jgi:putative Mg2+ transporter-C (MgtC) family protein
MVVTTSHQLIALLIATGLGSAIGLERELGAQPAGFRTHVLVALGASLFTIVGTDLPGSDPTRVAAQVVTGIGFLGAGAILRDGGSIKGLTTAASLWVTAAAGVACGLDRPMLATAATGITLLALIGLKQLERDYFPRRRVHSVVLEITDTADMSEVVGHAIAVLQSKASVRAVDRGSSDRTIVTLTSPLSRGYSLLDLAVQLRALEGVVGVELAA